MPSVLRQSLPIAVLALVLGSAATAMAQAGPSEAGRPTQAQLQKIFPDQKRLALSDHQARIAILQNGERCVSAAGSSDALRNCMKQEREAYQSQRQQHWSAMKSLFERNGIPLPKWGKGEGKGKWGERQQGYPGSI